MHKDIDELRKYYAGLNFTQKKEFVLNLKNKLENVNSIKHRQLLEECIASYNAEVRARNKQAGFAPKKPQFPDITADTFARALATMLSGGASASGGVSVRSRLIGKWQRDPEDGDFYYKFNEDGSFETNEFDGHCENNILEGNFSVGIDNVVLMEPHEKLRFTGLMFSQTGNSLIINLKDGLTFEYRRV
ncbi:MAG: hypothetical protein LBI27_04765 [Clostridiales bacterium]|jgi:hypothetical protein|nr:hypothetical protein [Clostridiales bacterium]